MKSAGICRRFSFARLEGLVRELFNVTVIPDVRYPMAVSPQSQELSKTVTRVEQFGSLTGD